MAPDDESRGSARFEFVRHFASEYYLQKLDFLLRDPRDGPAYDRGGAVATTRSALAEGEPELDTEPITRFGSGCAAWRRWGAASRGSTRSTTSWGTCGRRSSRNGSIVTSPPRGAAEPADPRPLGPRRGGELPADIQRAAGGVTWPGGLGSPMVLPRPTSSASTAPRKTGERNAKKRRLDLMRV